MVLMSLREVFVIVALVVLLFLIIPPIQRKRAGA
jgi:hypothetical protein